MKNDQGWVPVPVLSEPLSGLNMKWTEMDSDQQHDGGTAKGQAPGRPAGSAARGRSPDSLPGS